MHQKSSPGLEDESKLGKPGVSMEHQVGRDAVTELSILIVNYNSWALCVEALRSISRFKPPCEFEVIVVDNRSPLRDPEAEQELRRMLGKMNGQLIYHEENGGYSKGMNLAYARSTGRYVMAANPDLLFTPGCIGRLLKHLQDHPSTGVAVPSGFWDKEMILHLPPNILPTMSDLLVTTLGEFSRGVSRRYSLAKVRDAKRVWDAAAADRDAELTMISGCCFMMSRELIEQIGLLDERFPLYFEDADLCVRVRRARRRIVQVAGARLVHLYNQSGETDPDLAMSRHWISRRLFYRKWYGRIGKRVYDFCSRFPTTKLGRKLARQAPHGPMEDLGTTTVKPVLYLPRHCEKFMLQMSMDCRFYLSGALFGSGDSWTPSDGMWPYFSPTDYFCRAFDISGGKLEELMTYRFVPEPVKAKADAVSPLEGVHDRS